MSSNPPTGPAPIPPGAGSAMTAAPDEAALAAYLQKYIQLNYSHLLLNRYFQATVSGVNYASLPMQVQIVRVGETQSDGAWYPVADIRYYPVIGDQIELVWRDDNVAWVAWPMIAAQRTTTRMYRSGGVIPAGNAWSIIGMDTIDFDGLDAADPTSSMGVKVRAPGKYRVYTRAGLNTPAQDRLVVAIYYNGAEARRGDDNASPGGFTAGAAEGEIICNAGDLLQCAVFLGSTVGLLTGSATLYLEVTWDP